MRRVCCKSWFTFAAASLCAALLAGCDGSSGNSVAGAITIDGEPLVRGIINFVPEGGRPLGGPIQSDGTYQFDLPPGDYRVTIAAPAEAPAGWKEGDELPRSLKPLVPGKYGHARSSGLRLTVPEQPQPVMKDFNLLRSARKR